MNVDRAYHWLRSSTPLDELDDPDTDDDLFDVRLGDGDPDDDDDLDDPADASDDDDFDVPRDDLPDAGQVPDDQEDEDDPDDDDGWADRDRLVTDTAFETRVNTTGTASSRATNTTSLVAYFVNDADVLSDAAGAAAFLQQLCGEGVPYPTMVVAADHGSPAARFIAAALDLPIKTLTGLSPFDPHTESGDQFDDRTRDAIEDIQAAGGIPVVVGSASHTAYLAGVDVDDPQEEHAFSLLSQGGVLAITTRGLAVLHRPDPSTCTDCANADLPCPFHDETDYTTDGWCPPTTGKNP